MLTTACMRCGLLTDTAPWGTDGLLRLCARCVVQPPCAPFQHRYVGSARPGTHVCTQCGQALASVPISTDIVCVPEPPRYDIDD